MTRPNPYRPERPPAPDLPTGFDAGWSICPACGKNWRVTSWEDCLLPACGCYGFDASKGNRPCEACGTDHARRCDKMPDRGADEEVGDAREVPA